MPLLYYQTMDIDYVCCKALVEDQWSSAKQLLIKIKSDTPFYEISLVIRFYGTHKRVNRSLRKNWNSVVSYVK